MKGSYRNFFMKMMTVIMLFVTFFSFGASADVDSIPNDATAYVNADVLNLRDGVQGNHIGELKRGTVVKIQGYVSDGYYYITYDDEEGTHSAYAYGGYYGENYLMPTNNEYKPSTSKQTKKSKKTVIVTFDEKLLCPLSNFAYDEVREVLEEGKLVVFINQLNLRTKPSYRDGGAIKRLEFGEVLQVAEAEKGYRSAFTKNTDGELTYVRVIDDDGKVGYVSADYVVSFSAYELYIQGTEEFGVIE